MVQIDDLGKESFEEWLQHPVTKALKVRCDMEAKSLMQSLAVQAGLDPSNDRFLCGKIEAYLEISGIQFEETEIDE